MNEYTASLDAAWADHLAPRQPDASTVISTFAGCGGSSLGYSMAGFRELLAVEWDANAVETFRANFPSVPVYHGDIAALSVDECLRLADLRPGDLDVFDGSPPCQGFSTAGKRNIDDPRNDLFREYVRLLRGLMPRSFVMENVSGMVKGKMRLVFADCLRELKASGYRVSARLLNAMYFGVPQSRQRMIFVGVRDDLETTPTHPTAQTRPVTIREALPWVDRIDWDSQGIEGSRSFDPDTEPKPLVRCPGGGAQTRYLLTDNRSETDISRYAIGREWDLLKAGESSNRYFSLVKPDPDKPCPTVTQPAGGISAASVTHPTERRKFTIAELKRICAFPDEFEMVGSYTAQWARLGNSVPPLFMRAIAQHIRDDILTPSGIVEAVA